MALVAASKSDANVSDRQSVQYVLLPRFLSRVHGSLKSGCCSSFGSLLQRLEAHGGQLIPDAENFLVKNAARLQHCYDLFGPNAAGKAKGKEVTLQPREKELVKAIAQRLAVDEVEAGPLLRNLRRHLGEDPSKDVEASKINDDAFWEAITVLFFEERLAVLHVLAHILRTGELASLDVLSTCVLMQSVMSSVDLEDQPSHDVYLNIASQVSQPAFAKSLLNRVAHLASTPIPASSRPFASFWAKQYAKEQKALLELYFLLHYNKILPTGKTLLDAVQLVSATEWGLKQENEGYFDAEAYAQIPNITCLLILICLECLNLERASSAPGHLAITPGSPPAEDSLMHPAVLSKVHNQILELSTAQPQQSGPLLLAWAFVLSRITESMTSVQLPESYYSVAAEILASDMHPKRNTGQANANTSKQPIYQLLASHALSPDVDMLPAFQAVLDSHLLGNRPSSRPSRAILHTDPNIPGYLSVARSLLSILPLLVHPSYLPSSDFDSVIRAMEALYSNPAASLLRGQFWGLFEQADEEITRGEWEILEVTQNRFPAELEHFLRLMSALSGDTASRTVGDQDERELSNRCSAKVRDYMTSLPALTQILPNMSPVMPLPYEASAAIDTGPLDIVSTRNIPVSASVQIAAGCPGRFVSEQDRRPIIVSWDLSSSRQQGFSAWLLAGDVLRQFAFGSEAKSKRPAAEPAASAVDVFTGGSGETAQPFSLNGDASQPKILATILELYVLLRSERASC